MDFRYARAMEPSSEVRDAVRQLYLAMSSGDADTVETFYSPNPLSAFVGTDAAEVWTDPEQHHRDVRPYFDGSQGTNRWLPGDILARSAGDLGWSFDRPTVVLADHRELQLRVSLVWRREGNSWKVVHSHASVGQ